MLQTPPPSSHDPATALDKARARRLDTRRPTGGPLGLSARRRTLPTASSEKAALQQRLFRTRRGDADIFGMYDRMRARVPEWQIMEVPGREGQGDDSERELIEDFFHLPDGRHSFRQLLAVTADRLAGIGASHWIIRRADEEAQRAEIAVRELQRAAGSLGGLVASGLRKLVEETVGRLPGDTPVGFEVAWGHMEHCGAGTTSKTCPDGDFYRQTTTSSPGKHRDFPARDIVEFARLDPENGQPLGQLATVEQFSDADLYAFVLNRDGVRTGGMADKLLAMEGLSERERTRMEALMFQRSDPAHADKTWMPIITRLVSIAQRRPAVESITLSDKERDAHWIDWTNLLKQYKSAVTGVPLGLVGKFETLNRATIEVQEEAFRAYTYWPLFQDIEGPVNERVLWDEFRSADWRFAFSEPDLRSSKDRFEQEMRLVENGQRTMYAAIAENQGQQEADRIVADLEKDGYDGEALKLPMVKTGKGWTPIAQVVGTKEAPEGAPLPGPELPEAEEEEPEQGLDIEEIESALGGLAEWQEAVNAAARAGGPLLGAWPDGLDEDLLPRELIDHVDGELRKASDGGAGVRAVSDAFAHARGALFELAREAQQ